VKRILVVKLADLGDVLTATPAIRALRTGHPRAHLAALVTPRSATILAGTDLVDEIIPFEKAAFDRPLLAGLSAPTALGLARRLRTDGWDALALFHHLTTSFGVAKYAALCLASGAPIRAGLDNGRGWFLTHRAVDGGFGARHEVDYCLTVAELLGGHNPDPRLEIHVTPEDQAWAAEHVRERGLEDGRWLALHPGSGAFSIARRWPAQRFAAVARTLAADGLPTAVIVGPTPGEDLLARSVVVAAGGGTLVGPAPTPGALVALLGRSRLFLGNDGGAMNMAVAAGVPIVAVFGPSNDRAWGPYPLTSPRHAVVRETLACAPCIHRGHEFGTPAGCEARTCLDLIGPDAVIAAARRVLAATADRPERAPDLVGAP
jgi:heptosyltransferase-2